MTYEAQVRRLVELARVLVKRGLYVGLSDARPALTVRADAVGAPLEVTVTGDAFAWPGACHPVNDPVGAGERIAALVGGRTAPKP